MPVRPTSRAQACLLAAVTLLACGACGFLNANANPPRATEPAPTTSAAPASASPTGDGTRVAAQVDVDRPGGGSPAVITVRLGPVGTGVTTLNSLGAEVVSNCGLSDASTRWIPFEIDFADHGAGPSKQENEHTSLSARVELRGAGGDVGVLVAAGDGDIPGCTTRGKLPATDSFGTEVIFGGYHVRTSGYVVMRGDADLTGVTLALTGLQKKPDTIWPPGSWAWQVQRFETGGACPGDPASVCAPLGG